MAVHTRLPPSAMGFFVLLQVLASLSLPALARTAGFPSQQLIVPTISGVEANSEEILHRSQFPKDFIFGVGTSAYQVPNHVEHTESVMTLDFFSASEKNILR